LKAAMPGDIAAFLCPSVVILLPLVGSRAHLFEDESVSRPRLSRHLGLRGWRCKVRHALARAPCKQKKTAMPQASPFQVYRFP